jgi:hypothetical protein
MAKVKLQIYNDDFFTDSATRIDIPAWSNFVLKHIMRQFNEIYLGNDTTKLQKLITDELKTYNCTLIEPNLCFDSKEDMVQFLLVWS